MQIIEIERMPEGQKEFRAMLQEAKAAQRKRSLIRTISGLCIILAISILVLRFCVLSDGAGAGVGAEYQYYITNVIR
jgi:hypothetical protein